MIMNKIPVAVVILNFNGKNYLEKFLPTILSFSLESKIFIADNNSSDDSISFLKDCFPNVVVIKIDANYGYSKGYNIALKQINASYYILLNNDVEVTKDWISPLLFLMESNSKIAACQPKILDYKNQKVFEYAGAAGGFLDNYGYPFCQGRIFNTIENDFEQYQEAKEIFWTSGACMMIRADAFWDVEGFDNDFFAHMEEIDLCWRLKNIGYSVFVEPKSKVYHIGGGTLNKISTKKTFLNFRNNLITITKNDFSNNLILKLVLRFILDGIAAINFLLKAQPNHFIAVIRAHFSYYYYLPSSISKRKKNKKLSNFNFTKSLIYKGSIVLDYFIKSKRKFSDLKNNNFFN